MGKLQEAFVEIGVRLQKLEKGLNQAKKLVISGVKTMAIGAAAAGAAAFAGLAAVIGGAIPLVKLGSDLNEMRAKFGEVFKEEEQAARDFATALSDGIGRSQIEIEGFLSSFQDLFVPMGFARKDARDLSQTIVRLGYDLASFNNISDQEAIQTLNAGLTGSQEVLKKFGIFINDNVLSLKLQEMGLAKNAETASEQAKMMARLQIVLESTRDAQGDAARTADGLANMWKRLTSQIFDTASQIGGALVPAAQNLVGIFQKVADWAKAHSGDIANFVSGIGDAFDNVVGFVMEQVQRLMGVWQQNWDTFGPVVMEAWGLVSSIVVDGIASIIAGYVSWIEWGNQVIRAIFTMSGFTQESMGQMGGKITSTWEMIKGAVGTAIEYIKSAIETAIFVVMNWDLTAKRVGIAMAEVFTNIWRRITNTFENAGIAVSWFFSNFRDIAFSAFDAVTTAIINVGENIKEAWRAAMEYIKTGKFEPNFKPILDGAQNTISKMPKVKPFEPGDFSDQWNELEKETNDRMQKWNDAMKQQAPKAVEEGIEEGADDAKPKVDFTGKIELPQIDPNDKGKKKEKQSKVGDLTDAAEAWKQIQKSILGEKDKTPEKQLQVAKDQLAEQQNTNKKLDKKPVAAFG